MESITRLGLVRQAGAANGPFHTAGTGAEVIGDIFLGEAVRILGKLWCGERSDHQSQFRGLVI